MADWKWTDHIYLQLNERKISKNSVNLAINEPDEIVTVKKNRKIYQKIVGEKLIRVVTEKNKLITVYSTDKIKKYLTGDKQWESIIPTMPMLFISS